jgi:hypothetical protein
VELHIAGFVHAVNVAESGRDGEVWRNWGKSFVDSEDVLGLGVEGVVVDILVVDTVLLTTSDADFLDSISAHVLKLIVIKNLPSRAIASSAQHA